jgi:hypothetical protein
MSLTAERLRELLDYDPDTGVFVWKGRRAGRLAGRIQHQGYVEICVDQKLYQAHRLAWLYVHGRWPAEQIDHRDLDKGNNAIANLREATRAQNRANQRPTSRNLLGVKGVSKKGNRFKAVFRGKSIGYFRTLEEAAAAHATASKAYFGEHAWQAGGERKSNV